MRWTPVLAVILAAGCLDPAQDAEASLEGADPDAGERTGRAASDEGVRPFEGSFDLRLNPDHELLLATMVAGDANCVLFSDGETVSYRILGGTATLTWDALTPLAEELVLTAYGFTQPVQVAGPSPLTIDLAGLELPADGGGLAFMADHEVPHVPLQQPAKLHVAFEVEGDLPTPLKGFCTNGL